MIAKRIFDLLLLLLSLPVLLPIGLIVALLIRIKLGSPVLFRQERPGLEGRPFELVKFRSMLDAREADGTLLSDEMRLTDFGHKLRASSLDELPELWNIAKGEMSFVGPRPLLMQYLPLYSKEQARRHDVLPGVTGWAQIKGRNALSWDEKFRFDVWYVDNRSLWLDIKILVLTLGTIVSRKGVSADEHVTMPPFEGNNDEAGGKS